MIRCSASVSAADRFRPAMVATIRVVDRAVN
jgi:hypothetical protein